MPFHVLKPSCKPLKPGLSVPGSRAALPKTQSQLQALLRAERVRVQTETHTTIQANIARQIDAEVARRVEAEVARHVEVEVSRRVTAEVDRQLEYTCDIQHQPSQLIYGRWMDRTSRARQYSHFNQ